jgi:quinate dehydrogenase (quinone)
MWGLTPFDQLLCRIAFKGMRYDGLYTAPGDDISLSFPGWLGGMNWGGLSSDPVRNYIFANDLRLGIWIQMVRVSPDDVAPDVAGENVTADTGLVQMKGTPYALHKGSFQSYLQIPCQKPPFGSITAIDMKTQKIAWQVPAGTLEDTGPGAFRLGLSIPIGMPTLGGTLATQGGLLFIAGTQDFYLRALDTATGKELWKGRLPVGSQGGPITYKSRKSGKQFVLVSAGGARLSQQRGDYVIAYSLPQ